jgi:hypothetical protein
LLPQASSSTCAKKGSEDDLQDERRGVAAAAVKFQLLTMTDEVAALAGYTPASYSKSSPSYAHPPTTTTTGATASNSPGGFAATIPMVGPLNCSYNILLVYRLNEMRNMENLNFALAIACLGYW